MIDRSLEMQEPWARCRPALYSSGPCAAEGQAFRGTASFAGITTDGLADGESISDERRDSELTASTSYPPSEAADDTAINSGAQTATNHMVYQHWVNRIRSVAGSDTLLGAVRCQHIAQEHAILQLLPSKCEQA